MSSWNFVSAWWESIIWIFVIPSRHHHHLATRYGTCLVFTADEIWVSYINNVLSNKTILFDILDF